MRYLEGDELTSAIQALNAAAAIANQGPCAKSKRGVVFTLDNHIIGAGYNAPPHPYLCVPEYCGGNRCRDHAVHAEKNAMFNAMQNGYAVIGARAYHIKTEEGLPVPSFEPSCIPCSKDLLAAKVKEFVLVESVDPPKFALYEMEEFHDRSLRHHWGDVVDKLK